jgi:hypothetical protein
MGRADPRGLIRALHLDPDVWPDVNRCSDPSWVHTDNNELPDESTFRPSRNYGRLGWEGNHALGCHQLLRCLVCSKDVNNRSVQLNHIALHLDPDVWPDVNRCSDPSWVHTDNNELPGQTRGP